MPRIRTIKPEIWEDGKIGKCSALARLNFVGLISMADDEGRGQGDVVWLHRRLHAYAGELTEDSMSRSLHELEETGAVIFYDVRGETYYWLPNFLKHQKINRPTPSRLPPPPGVLPEPSVSTQGRNGMDQGMEIERNGSGSVGAAGGTGNGEEAGSPSTGATGFPTREYRSLLREMPKTKKLTKSEAKKILGTE